MAKKYLFIDRDGTLVKEPEDYQVDALSKIALTEGAIPALLALKDAGYTFVMVSNQDGLGTASFPLHTFTPAHEFILDVYASQGIHFEEVLICPHKPEDHCECRKPKLGMVMGYLKDTGWDRAASAFIGDRDTDLQMADNMGIRGFKLSDTCSWADIARTLTKPCRQAHVTRRTGETDIDIFVDLDRSGGSTFETGMGFFDHMLDQIATHGGIHMEVKVKGDLNVDEHHSIEDTGLALGQALRQALGDKRGIGRFGFCLPMDEVYAAVFADKLNQDNVTVALDISGRPHADFDLRALDSAADADGPHATLEGTFSRPYTGTMPVQMVTHFFESLAMAMGLTLHLRVTEGNCHHQVEALFKAFGRALRQAVRIERRELPSSKGTL